MSKDKKKLKVLFDTSFLVQLSREEQKAKSTFEYLIEEYDEVEILISTISLSEYNIKGNLLSEFEYMDFTLVDFGISDAEKAAKLFCKPENYDRKCLKDDIKILSTAILNEVDYLIVYDDDFKKITECNQTKIKVVNLNKENLPGYYNPIINSSEIQQK